MSAMASIESTSYSPITSASRVRAYACNASISAAVRGLQPFSVDAARCSIFQVAKVKGDTAAGDTAGAAPATVALVAGVVAPQAPTRSVTEPAKQARTLRLKFIKLPSL